jgi:hypothetical protein
MFTNSLSGVNPAYKAFFSIYAATADSSGQLSWQLTVMWLIAEIADLCCDKSFARCA